MSSTYIGRQAPRSRKQSGVVLVVALVIMGIMAIASTAALKLALSGSQVAQGLRSANMAMQAAESGLRWCELQTRLAVSGRASAFVPNTPQTDPLWTTRANFGSARSVAIPAGVLAAQGLVNFPTMPDCISEEIEFPEFSTEKVKDRVYLVTVRGFSPDYSRTANNAAGGEVWLQSRLYLPQ